MATAKKEEFQFKTEMSQLLHLLTHSLYTHKDVFLRELISNSTDALNKIHFASLTDDKVLGKDNELKIKINFDEKEKTFSIADNGVGMTNEELMNNIGTIAKSGTESFLEKLTGDKNKDIDLIGKFGVGFYSVFMVADEVTVESKSFQSEQAYKWISKGTGSYTIEKVDLKERGTKISFVLKKECEEFASKWKVDSVIRKYSDFVSFPIEVNGEKSNKSSAIWTRPKKEVKKDEYKEFFKYISNQMSDPMGHLHLSVEAPNQFKSILFIPGEKENEQFTTKLETHLHLYGKRIFIQDDCKELLPSWLRFVRGVVDSEDLPLNVSREVTQNSPVMGKIKKYLVRKLLSEFKSWAKKDEEKYHKFWDLFGNIIKEGLHQDVENRDKLLELYRCHSSSNPNNLISLGYYVGRMGEDQKDIYYVSGKSKEIIESSPNLEYFKKNNLEVLYLYEEIDDFIFPSLNQYKEKNFVGIAAAELKDEEDKSKEKDEKGLDSKSSEKLIQRFKSVLGDKVSDVVESIRLVSSPCTLVAPKDGMNAHMERMMKMMNQGMKSSKKVLEVNLKNKLVQNISKLMDKSPQDDMISECIEQLFDSASLQEGLLEDPSKMIPRVNALMEKVSSFHLNSLK